ncbi:MAG: hypothetical protein AAF802_07565 [Planctomycetota bacterium]
MKTRSDTSVILRVIACLFLISAAFGNEANATEPNEESQTKTDRFVFVIPGLESKASVTDQRRLLDAPAGKHGFIKVKDGHFFCDEKRIRFWGMNLCFPANFPTHDVADQLAPHLAKLGINSVRFHHMDMQDALSGIWGGIDDDGERYFSDEMVDRLDYFLARLAENGIYSDLNMHVSRTLTEAEGFPVANGGPWWSSFNKWVMYYDRDVQAKLKEYCREFLTHRNPYRNNMRRVDDPSIALVEMLNENYFTRQGYALYRRLPERFQASFILVWNKWLIDRYETTAAMRLNWAERQPEPGDYLIDSKSFDEDASGWTPSSTSDNVQVEFNVQAPKGASSRAIRLTSRQAFDQEYEGSFSFNHLSSVNGKALTLSYLIRAEKPRSYHVEFSSSAGGDWRDLGLYEKLEATTDWQRVTRTIVPQESIEGEVRIQFSFGDSTVPIELAEITLREGSGSGELRADQTLEALSVAIPGEGSPVASHADMKQFMSDTEVAWVTELKTFLREELGVKVPIVASQLNYHVPTINAELNDFVDLHNYWHHPLFPSGSNWDANRWTVGNEPMESDPARSKWPANSLLTRTGWRYNGKPFTLSEWCYPEPSPYSAGCVSMAAMLAALQDWDAVYFFQYDAESKTAEDWKRDFTTSYFSFNGQPVKLANTAIFSNVFLRGDLAALKDRIVAPESSPASGLLGLQHQLSVTLNPADVTSKPEAVLPEESLATPDRSIRWNFDPAKLSGTIHIDTAKTQGSWGTIGGSEFETENLSCSVEAIQPNYASLILTSMDDQPIALSKSMVLLASSSSENHEMGWNEERNSVGTHWGVGPTTVVGVTATIRLSTDSPSESSLRVFALDGSGQRQSEVPVSRTSKGIEIEISPAYKTLWYEVAR